MGIIQKDALRTSIVSYLGMGLGYFNKVFLFILLLTTEEIGLVNLILSSGILFAQLANLGTINTTWKFFPFLNNKEKNHYGFLSLNFLIVFSGIFFFGMLFILLKDIISPIFIEKSSLFIDYYFWVIPTGIGIVLFKLLENYLRALYKNVFAVIANDVILRLFTSGLLALYAFDLLSFEHFVMAISLSHFIPPALLLLYLWRLNELNISFNDISIPRKFRKIIVSYSIFSYVNSLASVLVISLDAIMITSLIDLSANGVYSVVSYLIKALMVPYAAIMRVSSPIVAQHWKDRDMVKLSNLYKQVSSVTLIIGLYFFLGIWVNRNEIFGLLPDEYHLGIQVFLYLMIGRLVDMYFGLNGTILVTSKKYKYDFLFTGALIIVVFLLNLWLIPQWGLSGAAISTTVAYLGYNLIRLIFVWRVYHLHPFKISQAYSIGLFVILLITYELFNFQISNVLMSMALKAILVTALYPMLLYLLKLEPELVEYLDKVRAKFIQKK